MEQQRGRAMPTYGYQCTQCKHEFQAFQAMKDAPISECPQCEGAVKRLLYAVGVVFKGSGWYINDSRKPEPTGATSDSGDTKSPEKSASDSGTSSTSPDKPASDSAPATTPASRDTKASA
jgi:putative FmdB family regulatory protein